MSDPVHVQKETASLLLGLMRDLNKLDRRRKRRIHVWCWQYEKGILKDPMKTPVVSEHIEERGKAA